MIDHASCSRYQFFTEKTSGKFSFRNVFSKAGSDLQPLGFFLVGEALQRPLVVDVSGAGLTSGARRTNAEGSDCVLDFPQIQQSSFAVSSPSAPAGERSLTVGMHPLSSTWETAARVVSGKLPPQLYYSSADGRPLCCEHLRWPEQKPERERVQANRDRLPSNGFKRPLTSG